MTAGEDFAEISYAAYNLTSSLDESIQFSKTAFKHRDNRVIEVGIFFPYERVTYRQEDVDENFEEIEYTLIRPPLD